MSLTDCLKYSAITIYCLLMATGSAGAGIFTVASYNVENLFDTVYEGTEYPDYVPGGKSGWNKKISAVKTGQIAQVITGMDADIVALQEIESAAALEALRDVLAGNGTAYPHAAVGRDGETAVRCALLSRFPILDRIDIDVPGNDARDILRVTIMISGKPLYLFINHWKSKTGPESRRIACAKALLSAVSALPPHADYLLLGDFNSDYNEFETIATRRDLNDTQGRTGINHILKTVDGGRLVTESRLTGTGGVRLHYNLWLEIAPDRRWSAAFRGIRQTPDSILAPAALYDDKGISYVDNSFDRFDPGYLFEKGRIFRWQRADKGRGRHLGKGYSDHLPIFAKFTSEPIKMQ